jgi:tetracycline repressor-like protein
MATASMSKRRQKGGDETAVRECILEAAFAAFMKSGYATTSTLEIATRAGVSKRELYALVGNKQEMLDSPCISMICAIRRIIILRSACHLTATSLCVVNHAIADTFAKLPGRCVSLYGLKRQEKRQVGLRILLREWMNDSLPEPRNIVLHIGTGPSRLEIKSGS